jgi:hypothetical protein
MLLVKFVFENSPPDFAPSDGGAWGLLAGNLYLLLNAGGTEHDYLKLTRSKCAPQADVCCYDFHNRFSSFNMTLTVPQHPCLIKCCALHLPYLFIIFYFLINQNCVYIFTNFCFCFFFQNMYCTSIHFHLECYCTKVK